jgi:hypothetical protein
MNTPDKKHPLVTAVEATLPRREARFDFMRAYDDGIRDSVKALETALLELHTNMSFGWVVRRRYKDGDQHKFLYMRCGDGAWRDDMIGRHWSNVPSDAEIFPTDFMVTVLEKLQEVLPHERCEAIELFTAI